MLIKKFLYLLLLSVCCGNYVSIASELEAVDITTKDGVTYKDAIVEGVNPAGIDIGFVNERGLYVLKGLSFENLPEDICQKYTYKPQRGADFTAKVNSFSDREVQQVAQENNQRLSRIMKELKAKFAGESINIQPADLQFAIYANRRAVQVLPLQNTPGGCVVKLEALLGGKPLNDQYLIIDGEKLPPGKSLTGFIYPTGLRAKYRQREIFVYAGNLKNATNLLTKYMEIYSRYATQASEDDKKAENLVGIDGAPDLSEAAAEAQFLQNVEYSNEMEEESEYDDFYANAYPYYYNTGISYISNSYGYYMGGSYYPISWWNNNPPLWRPPNRPHRPHRPNRPNRPNHPDRPDRPNRPDKPNRPDQVRPNIPGEWPNHPLRQQPWRVNHFFGSGNGFEQLKEFQYNNYTYPRINRSPVRPQGNSGSVNRYNVNSFGTFRNATPALTGGVRK